MGDFYKMAIYTDPHVSIYLLSGLIGNSSKPCTTLREEKDKERKRNT